MKNAENLCSDRKIWEYNASSATFPDHVTITNYNFTAVRNFLI